MLEPQDLKLRFAVLWFLLAINTVAYLFIFSIDSELQPELPAGAGFVIAFYFFVPCLLAWLSVVSLNASRWPNVVFGVIFALYQVSGFIGFVSGQFSLAVLLNCLLPLVAASFIVWYAWKLPAIVGAKH